VGVWDEGMGKEQDSGRQACTGGMRLWSRVGWHVWTSRRATSWVTWAREGMWTRQEMV